MAFFQLEVASLNLSWWGMVGSVSFKRAISVCMNLLKALSFFFPPPPDDFVFRGGFSVAAFFSVVAIGQSDGVAGLRRRVKHCSTCLWRLTGRKRLSSSGGLEEGRKAHVGLGWAELIRESLPVFADRDTLIAKTPGTCMHPCTYGHVRRTVLVPEDALEVEQVV